MERRVSVEHWNDETNGQEFGRQTPFSKWNTRGQQSSGTTLYPSSGKQDDRTVTMNIVKQVALNLLKRKYSIPLPNDFLSVLKVKQLDDFLATLLLYMSCCYEHRLLEEKMMSVPSTIFPSSSTATDMLSSSGLKQLVGRALAKVDLSQRMLAVSYSNLILWLGEAQYQRTAQGRIIMSSVPKEHLLHECLYRFFCYVAWLTFGRKDLKDIQENVGCLLYPDWLNPLLRQKHQRDTTQAQNVQEKEKQAAPRQQALKTFEKRNSQKFPKLSTLMTQRCLLVDLMLSLPGGRSGPQGAGLPQAQPADTEALMEELHEQLSSFSFGILGKPLSQFSSTTLRPKALKAEEDGEEDERKGVEGNNVEDSFCPGMKMSGNKASFSGSTSPAVGRQSSTRCINTGLSRATTEAVSSDTE